ncbi:SMP-30/gluconolactonase/LRE family protein [Pedobacter sp. ISL-68]|uniref:SMP-30/gluconolactonase/LRE family protein n=1 Tax=unclassified Pedobacter TaxID=2628915 RepID=UPI001BEC50EE|nr:MULTISPECIES: SMP-30/gluconolactonase/LRE family protein [unclassified Pedobacter]MBT2560268.1 SMP-30/gluconolactonase/LRE family protein [Pedobacter sp. ISL-64]MBT2589248.1 SMP-30/gluconolactonase/LRE family protein [Pedobacter sp. ISL-68]
MSSIYDFKLSKADFQTFGNNLSRPECVWCSTDGIWVSDNRGGLAQLDASGAPILLGSGIAEPNGFCRMKNGAFLVGGLSDRTLHMISQGGVTTPFLTEIDGQRLGVVNHAWCDVKGRIWISVMTKGDHWYSALENRAPDGYIVLIDGKEARIVTENLYLTNEVKVSPDGNYLYAAESLARRIVRFRITANNDLGPKEFVGPEDLGPGNNPDGFTLDAQGNVWVVLVAKNGIGVITTKGDFLEIFTDINVDCLKNWVSGCENFTATAEHLGSCAGEFLKLPTSLAFGGEDLKTVYVGSLLSPHLYTFRAPVAGNQNPW